MTSKRKRLGSAGWQALVVRQVASGLSVAAFCARERVSAASFYQWRARLRADGESGSATPVREDAADAFVDLGALALGGGRLALRLDLGGGVLLQLSRG